MEDKDREEMKADADAICKLKKELNQLIRHTEHRHMCKVRIVENQVGDDTSIYVEMLMPAAVSIYDSEHPEA
jgi:hypothetical protein